MITATRQDETGCPWSQTLHVLEQAAGRYQNEPGNLLPILHSVQHALGYIPPETIPWLAEKLQRSRAEIQGVISFYHDFRQSVPATTQVRVCMAESCLSMGAERLLAHAKNKLGCTQNDTATDGSASVQAIYCLGLCAQSPALQINGQQYARVNTDQLDALLGEGSSS